MSEFNIARRYATSLLESAAEKKILDSVSEDVELIASALRTNPQLERVLSSPVVKPQVKLAIMDEIFKSKVSTDTIKFIHFLVEKGREDLLSSIIKLYMDLRDERLGIVNVDVKSPIPLSDDQIKELKNKLEIYLEKKVRCSFQIDEKMLGGFIVKVDDTVFDASLAHQLELLKKQFLKGGASLN